MPDYPDIYADGFSISAGPFGVTLTLHVTDPTGEPGPHEDPNIRVGRIRMSRELARVMVEQMGDILTRSAQQPVQGSSEVKH